MIGHSGSEPHPPRGRHIRIVSRLLWRTQSHDTRRPGGRCHAWHPALYLRYCASPVSPTWRAFDHVIESFRNDLYRGYKTSEGVPEDLLAQFSLAERATDALGVVVWPMVEFEADDAIAAAAHRWRDAPSSNRSSCAHPTRTWLNASAEHESSALTGFAASSTMLG